MNLRFTLLAPLALAFLVAGSGCSNKTSAERDSLLSQNKELQDQLQAERAAHQQAEQRANLVTSQATTPPIDMSVPPMDGGTLDVTGTPAGRGARAGSGRGSSGGGEVVSGVIEISGDVLFASGKAALTPAGKKALDSAASTLKSKYAGHQIRVEGYTDPSPVRSSGWDDNWDLGAARARSVLLYLEGKGIRNMYIASFGATKLKSTKNMAQNRRVDIVVLKG